MERIYLSSPHMGGKEIEYINQAFASNWIAPLGPNVTGFESELSQMVGTNCAVALSSGTAAIHLALKALDVSQGDEVFCSTLTFSASANPIAYEKAIPVFIDSDYETWNMCPIALQKAFKASELKGKMPKAVIVVNLFGQSADYDKIKSICDSYNVPIIEDAAESLGATYKGKQTGTIGEIGIFSFNGNKIITTSGGGMMVSNKEKHTQKALFWATQAREQERHYEHKEIGYNYRMSNVVAGIGRGQLHVLKDRIQKKKEIYETYKNQLSEIKEIQMMNIADFGESNYWLSVATIERNSNISPTDIMIELEKCNIEARPVWKPMHMQPVFKGTEIFSSLDQGTIAEDLFNRGICLPSDTKMSINQQMMVVDVIRGMMK